MHSTALTRKDLDRYRRLVESLVGRLSGEVSRLEVEAMCPTGSEGTAAEAPMHEPTPTTTEGDEEVALTALMTEEQLLQEARSALGRLDAGTFGQCESCGGTISRVRLDAVPYARRCIRCARIADPEPAK